ncbi:MAG: efflux RND transporter periplasmic adaptor subunit [Rhodocyclaceae bacterium]|nr:efflux RND transporter periplasmic adaptor subunit [Rhodocyclaceae bacterium]MCA3021522.1 efflux RND transporter periplasmic adaptor subunit [Rhodocyclaceae bacterium]MCA3044357.1 efflux RND transporter periplasmic adaptor subunit [Rhodocyclaceae bacterium]MCA3054069.1 efflux RND transporter periplasmic adaptor subunit [Rhodocyclaceae bacterium]MCA3057084.1 efflux RND transporter periplasmic adaptor subunit [Rhodocyclaceae bacterium]
MFFARGLTPATPSTSSSHPRKRVLIRAGVGLLTVALVGGSLIAWRVSSAKRDEPKEDSAKTYEFAKRDLAILGPVELGHVVPISGTLKPVVQAVVKSKVAAEVAQVHVREGERVASGQVLISLDTADLRARYDAQMASVAEMKARLDLARKNEANNRQLLQRNFISQNAFDAVSNTAEVAHANLKSAEAQAAISQRALNDATIRAPFNGIVAKRMVNVGEKVSPDMSVVQIVDLSRMELEAGVPVSEIPAIKIGQELSFTVDGFAARQFQGKVERINPTAEAGSRSISVFLSLANPELALKGGMFATGKLAAQSRGAVNSIPLVALREEGGQSYVFVIEQASIVRKPVSTGTRNVDLGLVEIRDGLDVGAQVVAVKMEGLKAGAKAIVKTEATEVGASSPAPAAKLNKS